MAIQKENAAKATAVQTAVKSLGIADKAVRTQNYSFRPTYERNDRRDNIINGYAVENYVVVTVDNLSLVGKVIDAALKAGANQVNSLNFAAKNTDELQRAALLAAVSDAKSKAAVIAQGLNAKISGVMRVSESVSLPRSPGSNMVFSAKMTAMEMDAATPVEVPELTVSANVHIDFLLEN